MAKQDGGKKATADSLMNEAANKRAFSKTQSKIANAQIKRGTGEQVMVLDLRGTTTPTAKERLKIAADKERSAMVDEYQARKLTGATRAKQPAKMPKPRKSVQTQKKGSPNKDSSYYRKLSKAQEDSAFQMGMKNNPMGLDVLKRSVKNKEKAARLESKNSTAKKK
jgi:hypothetical protein